MFIDHDPDKTPVPGGQPQGLETEEALCKADWKYHAEDFLYPAKFATEEAVEEAEMKDELVMLIARKLAKILNKSGLRKRFELSEFFNDMLRFDEINDIEGVMFTSEDERTFVRVRMEEEKGGSVNFELMLCDNADDGLRVFDGTKWEYVNVREEYNVSTRLFQELTETGASTAEKELILSFCSSRKDPTKAAWDRFRKKNSAAFDLAEGMKPVLRMILVDDSVFLVPDDEDHVGIAMSCREDEFTVWQFFTNNSVLCSDERVLCSDEEQVVCKKKVFTLHGTEEALRFAQAHLDRNTMAEKAVTVPVSKTLVLHLGEDVLRNPDSLLDTVGTKDEKRRKNLESLADAIKKAKKAAR